MNIPFLDLKANYLSIKDEVLKEMADVLDNTYYILGPKVSGFEEAFAKAHQVKHCIGVSTGTDGNHLASWGLDIGVDDEIIMPANTFIATAWGATLVGARPVFVDCHPDTYNIDPEKIEAAITAKTKAIVAVHLYGQPADMDPIREIASRHGLYVIEDAAQAHLAEYKGQPIGGLGDVASFSFYPGKNLGAWGEGGAVTTNKDELAEKILMIRNQGQEKKYYHKVLGHNYRMAALQGAVLGVKMNYIAGWTENRRKVAAMYRELLSDVQEIKLPVELEGVKHVYHLFVIQTDNREELGNYLNGEGVATGLHYPIPLHIQECFANLGYKKGDFPVSETLGDHCLSLPIFPEMTEEQVRYVANAIRRYFKREEISETQKLSV